jgi:hypothetical protein
MRVLDEVQVLTSFVLDSCHPLADLAGIGKRGNEKFLECMGQTSDQPLSRFAINCGGLIAVV